VKLGAVWTDEAGDNMHLPSNVVEPNRRLGYVLLKGECLLTEAHIMLWRTSRGSLRSTGLVGRRYRKLYR